MEMIIELMRWHLVKEKAAETIELRNKDLN